MAVPLGRTAEGFELQLGTNRRPFALTNLLLPRITDCVVTISSGLHRRGRIDLADLNWQRRRYDRWAAYGLSKLANLLFTLDLAAMGALPTVYAATQDLPGGSYLGPDGRSGRRRRPRPGRAAVGRLGGAHRRTVPRPRHELGRRGGRNRAVVRS